MEITRDFIGGNISAVVKDNLVELEPELRDTKGAWFYWAFCVTGAQGETVTFDFKDKAYVGYFGPAVSRDLVSWSWAGGTGRASNTFTYSFGPDETRVYFAHHMLYHPDRFASFASAAGLPTRNFATTKKGRSVDIVEFGEGDKYILLASRHHACESPGDYVMEGILKEFAANPLKGYRVAAVPFMDIDGVIDGDQGKNRNPHDHNRDYIDNPLYPSTAAIMEYVKGKDIAFAMDLHAPSHSGNRNDTVFLVRRNDDYLNEFQEFSSIVEKETAEYPNAMRHYLRDDINGAVAWNNPGAPTFSHFCRQSAGVKMSMTVETTYAGSQDNPVSMERLVNLGVCFARSIRIYEERLKSK